MGASEANSCDMDTQVFADMHDGDEKEVTISGSDMTIKPHGSDEEWVVNTKIDCTTGKATVDFDVPGKKDHPPVPIQATLFTSLSASGTRKHTFIYNDVSGTIVDDPTLPLNQWVGEASDESARKPRCPEKLDAVFKDIHDGDQKQVTIEGEKMTIVPSGGDQKWIVNAEIDRESCTAVIDFNVPGKPDFPPVNLTATYWLEYANKRNINDAFEFTDPSGTLPAGPLNRWVMLASNLVV